MRQLKIIFLVLAILMAAIDLLLTYAQSIGQLLESRTPRQNLGDQFVGLEQVFKDIRTVGYYTDKDLNVPTAIAQFEQAQYMLAPTVLDLNQTHYHFVLFDCTSSQAAMDAIKRLGLTPLKGDHGIFLALNPKGT